jgi:6,7-dimethyl-8-ribityllumazine synthase
MEYPYMQCSVIHTKDLSKYLEYIKKLNIAIVTANFNSNITHKLASDTNNNLINLGINQQNITHISVSGALEIPFALQYLAKKNIYQSLIAIGAVIRGDTYHFEIVCNQSCLGMQNISLQYNIPIINGILTTNTIEQAVERLEKAKDFAYTSIDMALLSTGIYDEL